MHFQAGTRGLMPIEYEIGTIKELYGEVLLDQDRIVVTAVWDGLRRFYVAESGSKERLEEFGAGAFRFLRGLQEGEEPMINMLCYYREGWQLLLFPRQKHRPWQYFEKGEKNILLSPASVDMGGTLITPLEKDFHKITRQEIEDIFSQVTFSQEHFTRMNGEIRNNLKTNE